MNCPYNMEESEQTRHLSPFLVLVCTVWVELSSDSFSVLKTGYSKVIIPEAVKMLESLYENPEKRQQLAKNGHTVWQQRFTWEKIAARYEQMYLYAHGYRLNHNIWKSQLKEYL